MCMKAKRIESTSNPAIKEALEVGKKRSRHGSDAFLIEGPHLLEAALTAGDRTHIRRVFFTDRFREREPRLYKRILKSGAELIEVKEHVMKKLSSTEAPQGVAALASCRQPGPDSVDLKGIVAVSDGIQDPGNLGAIIRTADAVGAKAVVLLPGSCDPFSGKALRASAGSAFNIPILYVDRDALVAMLKRRKIPLAVTTPEARTSIFRADLGPPVALAFGNEAGGISAELKEAARLNLRIPIEGRAESLNVASAAAVCLYEALRRARETA
jgi:TrmH family RNA methyltransferase